MRLLAFGDLHLGAGASLGRQPGDRLNDQSGVLDGILGAAAYHNAEAILVAGDVFEGPVVTPEQMDVFAEFVAQAHRIDVPVVAISGNGVHDASMRMVNGLAIFDRIPGVDVYSYPAVHDLGEVQIACLPWVSPARLIASYDGDVTRDSVNAIAAALMVKAADELCDPRVKPTVLMMHGSISGASLPQGISTNDLREPVMDLDDLLELGYAAIVAGHIHAPQWAGVGIGPVDGVWTDPDPTDPILTPEPFALYTGSPMPLNFGEAHVPHGCWLLDVTAGDTSAEFCPIESRPLVVIDYSDPASLSEPTLNVDGAIVKVRVIVTEEGRRRLDTAALRAACLEAGARTVKIEVETVREDRARVETVTDELEPLEAFDAWAEANGPGDNGLLADAREQMENDLEALA